MLDLSVIILTYNEEKHIARCIDNVKRIAKQIYVVDSYILLTVLVTLRVSMVQ